MTAQEQAERPQPKAKAVRTTVSLSPMVYKWGEKLSTENGFRSMSDYFEFLIRLHKGAPALK